MNAIAEIFVEVIAQGVKLIKEELSSQAKEAVVLRDELSIRNEDLLSDRLIINGNVHKTIKQNISSHSDNIGKIIAATAYYVQEEKFNTIDEALSKMKGLSKLEQDRLAAFASCQKKINLSYGTLSAVIEIFKGVNQSILEDIKLQEGTLSRLEKAKAYLKSSIISYELLNFVILQLSNFDINGIDDLKTIRNDVFSDIEIGFNDDENLKSSVSSMSNQGLKKSLLSEINDRNSFRTSVKEKWDEMFKRIDGQKENINNTAQFIGDLKIIRENIRNRINIMNIATTTLAVESSIETVGMFATSFQSFELPAMDEKLTRELLNLGV